MRADTSVKILDYGVGNIHSVYRACKCYSQDVQVVDQIRDLDSVSHLVLPGVGAFGIVMKRINENGLKDDINAYIQTGKPLLGICVGMQVLFDIGFENGINQGLGVIQGEVKNLLDDFSHSQLKIPNIGWSLVNRSDKDKKSKLFKGLPDSFYTYFAHSYSANLVSDDELSGYILNSTKRITAAVEQENVYGVQFHPEKSGSIGLQIIKNFIENV